MNPSEFLEKKDFSIVLGGPFFQLLRKAHLTGDALELAKKRLVVISVVAWLPLFVLTFLDGKFLPGSARLPFLQDFDVHIRFLITLPLFIISELVVHKRMMQVISQFQVRDLIPEVAQGKFESALSSALRWRNSVVAESIMVVVIYVIGYKVVWQETSGIDTTTWYTQPAYAEGAHLSFAGIWFRYVSLPLFQFLFLRWYYRIFIWARFLFQLSRIPLKLLPTHPDNVGGLGFLENSVHAFKPLAIAHGTMLAGVLSNHIFYDGSTLLDYKIQIAVLVIWVLLLVLVPLFAFSSQLETTRREGIRDYGLLGARYSREFENRWMREKWPEDHSALGGDIQSLADLANSHRVVSEMKLVPVDRTGIISIALVTLAPVAPLVLTMMPLSEALKVLAGVLF